VKSRTKPLSKELVDAAARARDQNVQIVLAAFGWKMFHNFRDFDVEWEAYCKRNLAYYRVRHSLTREGANRKIRFVLIIDSCGSANWCLSM
jgi:hypothetical protein